MNETTPILVVGMNRTGTKWVSNILCNHDDVVGAQSERSRGILETNMFGILQNKFDLSYPEEYVALLEIWSQTQLFRCANGDKEKFYGISPRPRSTLEMFAVLMRDFAYQNGSGHWLQKTSPREALSALQYFQDARVIVTRRNILDTLRSTWASQLRFRKRRIIRSTYVFVRQEKLLDRISRNYDAIEVQFDNLIANPDHEIDRLCQYTGLRSGTLTVNPSYKKNTSFANDDDRERIMSVFEQRFVVLAATLFRLIPLSWMLAMSLFKERASGQRRGFLVAGSLGPLVDHLADQSRDR